MSVGETLSSARRSLGLSLDDVASETRIRASLIAAIERDDFEPCGGAVYARGHLRSIARVLGIDAGPIVAEYDATHHSELPPVAASVAPQPTDTDLLARTQNRGRPNWTAAMGVALAAVCVLALVGLLISHSGGGGKHPTQAAQSPATVVTQPSSSTPASPPPTTVAEIPPTKATMVVRVLESPTWLEITSHNGSRVIFEDTLPAGSHKIFTAAGGLGYVIGNAPAVDLVVNGHDVGTPPSDGSVARGSIQPGSDTIQPA
ncbi:MAG TPA: RodZ domain-containing protein [Mycobacteriales bacterium]|nr:RodZ domain-containing protein [Mycobacteriales bacterium]